MAQAIGLVHQHCSILATVQLVEFAFGVIFVGESFPWIGTG